MKILFITTQFGSAYQQGTERYLRLISNSLDPGTFTFDIAASDPLKISKNHPWTQNQEGIYKLPYYEWPCQIGPNAKEIEGFYLDIKPDVIHILNLAHLGLNFLKVAKSLQIKLVMTFMDFWSICPKSTLMTPKQSLCEGQKDIDHCLKCINKGHTRKSFQVIGQSPIYFQNKIHQFKFKKLYSNVNEENAWHNRPQLTLEHFKNIDHAIFPSVTMKKHILNHHKIKKYELIPYGLDQSWFKEKPKHNHQTIQLGFIGSISKHKGLHLIFEALTTLNNKQLNFNIAGPILDKNYYDYIKNNYQEITYHYEGELIEQQLKSFYQKLDLLIVPSLWPENTPFVIYESLALSTNVLASDHESIREQINHPQFLFKPNSHKSLAEKLNKIIEQKLFLSPSPKVNRVEQMIQSISKIYQNV